MGLTPGNPFISVKSFCLYSQCSHLNLSHVGQILTCMGTMSGRSRVGHMGEELRSYRSRIGNMDERPRSHRSLEKHIQVNGDAQETCARDLGLTDHQLETWARNLGPPEGV